MNTSIVLPPTSEPTGHRVEFFRLPAPGKRDPFFGLSRGWYYKAAAADEIKMVAVRQRGALRGVRLIAYDSVVGYIRRSMKNAGSAAVQDMMAAGNSGQLSLLPASLPPQDGAHV